MRDGDEWVISGEKFFSSNLRTAQFLIVMAVTNPDVSPVPGHVHVPGADAILPGSTSCTTWAWERGVARGDARSRPL